MTRPICERRCPVANRNFDEQVFFRDDEQATEGIPF